MDVEQSLRWVLRFGWLVLATVVVVMGFHYTRYTPVQRPVGTVVWDRWEHRVCILSLSGDPVRCTTSPP